ncbi:MAG: hypothetical protein LBG44_04945 [Gemmatimonadota bacterium]|jgi:hypothetical protein|nr:hypothetical protein [Gemmatimonadota bacterium]
MQQRDSGTAAALLLALLITSVFPALAQNQQPEPLPVDPALTAPDAADFPEPVSFIPVTIIIPSAASTSSASGTSSISPRDSINLLKAGRDDQAAFERIRRDHLGFTRGSSSTRCDERVGRFCLNRMGDSSNWIIPEEHTDVVKARADLITGLRMATELLPGDHWLVGERVAYLVEAREFTEAADAVTHCRAEEWWCSALAGYVFHYAGQAARADSAYEVALSAMDSRKREEWTDLSLILDNQSIRSYRRLTGMERSAFEERFWRLADPLLSRPGNELRAEHLSRHVRAEMQSSARSVERLSWGWDMREILIRFGWPIGWEQLRDFGMTPGPAPLVSHYSNGPGNLLPPAEALRDPVFTGGDWNTDDPRSRTGYNIPLPDSIARWFDPLAHQIALFPDGERLRLVAAFELPPDSVPEGATVEASLVFLPTTDPGATALIKTASSDMPSTLLLEAPATPAIVGIEVLVPSGNRLARVRYGINPAPVPAGSVTLSDLLLIRDGTEPPTTLEAAVPLARGSTEVVVGERISLFWESRGIDATETPTVLMSLRLLEPPAGWLRRIGQHTGLVRDSNAIRLRWEEPVPSEALFVRSMYLEVPPVKPGVYSIELTVEVPGHEAISTQREIQISGR